MGERLGPRAARGDARHESAGRQITLLAIVFARTTSRDEIDDWTRRLGVLARTREAAGQRLDLFEETGEQREAVNRELQRALYAT